MSSSVRIAFDLAPDHHAYLDQFKIEINDHPGGKANLQSIKPIVEFQDKFSKKVRKGVEGSGEIIALVEFSHDPRDYESEVQLQLTYQACTTEYCLLPKIITASARLPAGQTTTPTSSSGDWFQQLISQGYLSLFLVVFGAGILTSFTPCVFPMIPITLAVLGARTGRSRRHSFWLSLCYVLGIASTYSILGLAAASTGALFGSFLGNPFISLGLAVLFLILALSSFGLFEIQAPSFVRDRLGLHKTQGGYVGAFLTGQLAGVIASPCVGPVLAAILAYIAKTQNLTLGFGLMFVFALGMGQLFLVLGTFSHASKWLPKSGPWMLTVKYIFGLTFIGLAVYYAHPTLNKQEWYNSKVNALWGSSTTYEKLPFQEYNEVLITKAAADGKPVLIDFWADWCVACKELEVRTFSQPEVQKFKDQFIFLKFDATQAGEEFERLREKYDIFGLPHLVIYDKSGTFRRDLTLTGFEEAPTFAERLKKALSP